LKINLLHALIVGWLRIRNITSNRRHSTVGYIWPNQHHSSAAGISLDSKLRSVLLWPVCGTVLYNNIFKMW